MRIFARVTTPIQFFVFNTNGRSGSREHQMGGGSPQRRSHNHANQPPKSPLPALQSFLPLLLLIIIIPLFLWLFSDSTPKYPRSFRFDSPLEPHTLHRVSAKLKVDYWTNPKETGDYSTKSWRDLDSHIEGKYLQKLGIECDWERHLKQRAFQDAQGLWSRDQIEWQRADAMTTPACDKLSGWGYRAVS